MKSKLQETREKGLKTLLAISVIGVAVYLGFTPLFNLVQGGVAGKIIGASFAVIFVIVLTMYVLNKQTELEQESKRSEKVFGERVSFYNNIIENVEKIFRDNIIHTQEDNNELSKLEFILLKLQMLAEDKTIEKYQIFYDAIIERGGLESQKDNSEEDVLIIPIQNVDKINFREFIGQCRIELGLSEKEMSTDLKEKLEESNKKLEEIKPTTAYRTSMLGFWKQYNEEIEKYPDFIKHKETNRQWRPIYRFNKGAKLIAFVSKKMSRIEIYIDTKDKNVTNEQAKEQNEKWFEELRKDDSSIVKEINNQLNWDKLEDKRACRISLINEELLMTNQEDWSKIIEFFIQDGLKMKETFEKRIKKLEIE